MMFAYYCITVIFVIFPAKCFTHTSQVRVPRCTGGSSLRGLSIAQFLESINSKTPLACCEEDGVCHGNQKPGDLPMGTSTFDLNSMHWGNVESSMHSRSKRDADYCPDSCPLPSEISVCPSNTSILFPLSGTSIISEKRVDIAQYPPAFIQPVIYHRCSMAECRILGGSCVQVLVPQAVFVYVQKGNKVETEVDFVYVEGGCKCVPAYSKRLRGRAIEADPILATVIRAATGRHLDFAALQAHLMSPNVFNEDQRGPLVRSTLMDASLNTDEFEAPTSDAPVTTTLPYPVSTTRPQISNITEAPLKDFIMAKAQLRSTTITPTVQLTNVSVVGHTTASSVQLTTVETSPSAVTPIVPRHYVHNMEPDSTVDSSIHTSLTENKSTMTNDPKLREISTTRSPVRTDGMQKDTTYSTTSQKTQGSTEEDAIAASLSVDAQTTEAFLLDYPVHKVNKVYEARLITRTTNKKEQIILEATTLFPTDKQTTTNTPPETLWERFASDIEEDNEVDVLSLVEKEITQLDISELKENENVVNQDLMLSNVQKDEDRELAYNGETLLVTELADNHSRQMKGSNTQSDLTRPNVHLKTLTASGSKTTSASENFQIIVPSEKINVEESAIEEAVGSATLELSEAEKHEDTEERSGEGEMQARSLEPEDNEVLETYDSLPQASQREDLEPAETGGDDLHAESLHLSQDPSDSDPDLAIYDQNSMDADDVFINDNSDPETNEIDYTKAKITRTDQSEVPLQPVSNSEKHDKSFSNELTLDSEELIDEQSDFEGLDIQARLESIHSKAFEADEENEIITETEDTVNPVNFEHSDDLEPLAPLVIYLEDEDTPGVEDPAPDSEDLVTKSHVHEGVSDVEHIKQEKDDIALTTTNPSTVYSDNAVPSTTKPLKLTEPDTKIISSEPKTPTSELSGHPPDEPESHSSPFQYLLNTFTTFFVTNEPDIATSPPTVPDPTVEDPDKQAHPSTVPDPSVEIPPEDSESSIVEVEDHRKAVLTLPLEELPCANCPISIPPSHFDPIKKLLKKYST